MSNPTTTSLLRQINREAVLRLVRRQGVMSPTALATALNLSLPTITRVLDMLVEERLVAYDGYDETSRGRPAARVKFTPSSHALLGVEASVDGFYGAVADMDGTILCERQLAVSNDAAVNVATVLDLIEHLLAQRRPANQPVRGIGIGVPSIVQNPEGVVVHTMGLEWRNLALRSIVEEKFKLPVFVEKNANLSALGQWGFGAAQGAKSLVSLVIAPGTGAGILIDGKVVGGRRNAAGEISWYLTDPLLAGRTFPDLGDKARLRFGGGIPEGAIDDLELANAAYVSGRMKLPEEQRDPLPVSRSVEQLIDLCTMAVSAVSAILNPEVIVITGHITRGDRLVLDVLDKRLRDNIYDPPRIVMGGFGHRDVVMGSLMMVLEETVLKTT